MTGARWLETDTTTDHDLSSAHEVGSYTADADRLVAVQVLLDTVAGEGDYFWYATLRVGGAGSSYVFLPKTTATAAAGETAIGGQSLLIGVRNTDILKVYVDCLAADSSVDSYVRFFEVAALQPATADRTLVVDAAGLADANAVKVGPTGSGTAQTAGDICGKIGAPSDLGSGASLAKNLVDIEGQTDDIGAAGAGLTALPGVTLANGAHGGAAATITLQTPIAATVPDSQKVDVNTIKTKAVTVDTGGTTFPSSVGTSTYAGGAVASVTGDVGGLTADAQQDVADALKLAPSAGDPAAGSVNKHLDDILSSTSTPILAISATQAAAAVNGALGITTYHTFSQAITSTSTATLNTATKCWLAIKLEKADADAASVVFIEAAGGLTVLAGAAYTTVAHGTLAVSGSSGAWIVALGLDEVATGLLAAYVNRSLYAEVKALVSGNTVPVWSGTCDIAAGVVQAVT